VGQEWDKIEIELSSTPKKTLRAKQKPLKNKA